MLISFIFNFKARGLRGPAAFIHAGGEPVHLRHQGGDQTRHRRGRGPRGGAEGPLVLGADLNPGDYFVWGW